MKKLFDYFLTQLNANTDDLTYRGNFLFQFSQDKLVVYNPVEGKLVNEEVVYRPIALTTSESVPFVEDNGRIDWLFEYGVVVPISGDGYDEDDDLDYANIKNVCESMNGAKITIEGTTYAVKVSPYPKYSGFAWLGNSKHIILSIVMNVTELESGEFGQDSTWYLNDTELDVITADVTSTRRFYSNDKKGTTDNDFNKPIGRVKMVTLTINYDPDNLMCVEIFKESRSTTLLKKEYTLKETHNILGDFTNSVIVRSATESSKRNSVRRFIVEFVQAID
jgi:hypothetical protein